MATNKITPEGLAIGARVRSRLHDLGITQGELATAVGMKQQGIASILAGQVKRPKKLWELARALKTTEAWLLGEPGAIPPQDATELQRVPEGREFEPDPDFDAGLVATIGNETGARGIPTDASPEIDLTAGLGGGGISIIAEGIPGKRGMTFAAEHIRDHWRLPPRLLTALSIRAHDIAIFPVEGDSMAPTLIEGDYVFIDTRHRIPSPAGLYAIIDEAGGVAIKRLEVSSPPGAEDQTIRVISDNERHRPKEWRAEDLFIVGRVVRRFGVIR
ncbi:XRE family transcriptional regulator [Rhodoligotrophos ferricapiens]|uniref:XRE family transcriptional regulator n=1 Tax=Rhodoligotrophos ferricapiens TaxID=3069264 RepID=UPI00315DA5AC